MDTENADNSAPEETADVQSDTAVIADNAPQLADALAEQVAAGNEASAATATLDQAVAETAPSALSVSTNLTEEQLAEGAYYPGVRAGISSLDDILHQQAYNDAFQLSMVTVTLDGQPVEGEALTALLDSYQQALAANDALAAPEGTEDAQSVAEANGQETPAEVLKDVLKAKRGKKQA